MEVGQVGKEQGEGGCGREQGDFFSYGVAADWSLCHHLEVRVVSESPVTPLSALFCHETGPTSLMADPHLGSPAGL